MYRQADLNDLDRIYELICDLEDEKLPYEIFREIYMNQLADESHCHILSISDKGVSGLITLRFEMQLHHAGLVAEIMEFITDTKTRQKGIGRGLYEEACRIAKSRGALRIEASCHKSRSGSHEFYMKQGMGNNHYKFTEIFKD